MGKISTSDFTKGTFIEFRGEPFQITEFQFYNPGKGSAVVRTRLKNIKSGRVLDFTFKSGETVEEIPVETKEMQYLYKAGEEFVFMNQSTFEQINIKKDLIGNFANFIKEGDIIQVILNQGQALSIRVPKKVRLKVVEAEEGAKGDTVGPAKKNVKIETGTTILVPIFIKEGDVISIDPESGEYVERVSQK